MSSVADRDMRDVVFDAIYDLAKADPRVVLLTGDQGAFGVDQFRKDFPERFWNMGIAEQNLINVASGLALTGKRPFVYAIGSFLVYRAYEQIKLHLSGMELPVVLVGSGAGLTYDLEGPTHHVIHDLALIRGLPQMSVYTPADSTTSRAVVLQAYASTGASYIRLDKGVHPRLHSESHDYAQGFGVVGELPARVIIASSGVMVHRAVEAIRSLPEIQNARDVSVLDLYRVSPLDEAGLLNALRETKLVVVLEEHADVGGLHDLFASFKVRHGLQWAVRRLGVPGLNDHVNGRRNWLHARYEMDSQAIIQAVRT